MTPVPKPRLVARGASMAARIHLKRSATLPGITPQSSWHRVLRLVWRRGSALLPAPSLRVWVQQFLLHMAPCLSQQFFMTLAPKVYSMLRLVAWPEGMRSSASPAPSPQHGRNLHNDLTPLRSDALQVPLANEPQLLDANAKSSMVSRLSGITQRMRSSQFERHADWQQGLHTGLLQHRRRIALRDANLLDAGETRREQRLRAPAARLPRRIRDRSPWVPAARAPTARGLGSEVTSSVAGSWTHRWHAVSVGLASRHAHWRVTAAQSCGTDPRPTGWLAITGQRSGRRGVSVEAGISAQARERSIRPVPLTWRRTSESAAVRDDDGIAVPQRVSLSHLSPDRTFEVSQRELRAPLNERQIAERVLDPALVDRLSDHIMRTLERRARIERERRGI
jgi:hypothetical protein